MTQILTSIRLLYCTLVHTDWDTSQWCHSHNQGLLLQLTAASSQSGFLLQMSYHVSTSYWIHAFQAVHCILQPSAIYSCMGLIRTYSAAETSINVYPHHNNTQRWIKPSHCAVRCILEKYMCIFSKNVSTPQQLKQSQNLGFCRCDTFTLISTDAHLISRLLKWPYNDRLATAQDNSLLK